MNPHRASVSGWNLRWLGWAIVGVYFVLAVVGIALQRLAGATYLDLELPALLATTIVVGIWPILGAIIVARHPTNPVGWILSLTLITWGLQLFAAGYAAYGAADQPPSLPGEALARLWLSWDGFPLPAFGLVLLFLLFPNGKLLSRRWTGIVWIALIGLGIYLIVAPLWPRPLDIANLRSPLAVDNILWNRIRPLQWVAIACLMGAVVAGVISLIRRLHRAKGEERQQLKWIAYAMAFYPLSLVFAIYATVTGSVEGAVIEIGVSLTLFTFLGIAIATSISILKYRLYDIDLLINRTLVYGVLTASLVVVYLGGVLVFRAIIGQLTGQESPVAIVASTLLVAALFQPLRRGVQQFIDRRFYRRKYDAARTLARFGSTLRDEIDPQMLSEALLNTVDEAVQPAHLSLWILSEASNQDAKHTDELD